MLLLAPVLAALTGWYGPDRVRAVTTLSLVAGFSSTLFAPLIALLVSTLGWRNTYVVLAVMVGAITLPLHLLCLTPPWPGRRGRADVDGRAMGIREVVRSRPFICLALATSLASFGLYGATIDLVPMLTSRGLGNGPAATLFAVLGAGQCLGRVGYPALARRTSPATRMIGGLAAASASVLALATVRGPLVTLVIVAIAAGTARGMYQLLQATAVSDRWGIRHYPSLNGVALAPATGAFAVAPAATTLLAQRIGGYPPTYLLLAVLILVAAAIAGGTRTSVGPDFEMPLL